MRDGDVMSIGELARSTAVTTRTLRHYDQLGLLRPTSRSASGHRCYSPDDVRRLHRIVALRSFGLSLDDVAAVLGAHPDHDPAEVLLRHLAVVEERKEESHSAVHASAAMRGRRPALIVISVGPSASRRSVGVRSRRIRAGG